jgi:hypothetical protein
MLCLRSAGAIPARFHQGLGEVLSSLSRTGGGVIHRERRRSKRRVYVPKSTDITRGWHPTADRIGIPDTNFSAGNMGRKAVVIHIMDSSLLSTISWFANSKSQVSSHFAIAKNGTLKQFVSVVDTSYANGLSWNEQRKCWIDPAGNALKAPNPTPKWELLSPPTNPNFQTIAIELEGKPSDKHPAAMLDACVDLLQWLAGEFSALRPYVVPRTLIGHRHIGPKHRANCPGPNIDLTALALQANGPTDWDVRWGPVATPDHTSWQWAIPQAWQAHWVRLGPCVSNLIYDEERGWAVQCFAGGDVRQHGSGTPEVCFK